MADDDTVNNALRAAGVPRNALVEALLGARNAIPENKEHGISLANMLRGGLGAAAGWMDWKNKLSPDAYTPQDVLAPTGGMAFGSAPVGALAAGAIRRDAAGAVMNPKRLEKGLAGEPGWAYHATNEERLRDIASSGKLNTHRPHEFTDQSVWPDGARESRAYFGASPEHLWQFAPEEGMPVAVRTKMGDHIVREGTGDLFTRKPIDATQLEFLGADGQWHSVLSMK